VLCSLQDHLRIGIHDIGHPILAGAKNTNKYDNHQSPIIIAEAALVVVDEHSVGWTRGDQVLVFRTTG
jgi:hypothetical protein